MSSFYDGVSGRRVYNFSAVALDTATVIGQIQGPPGKVGRVVGFEYVVTVTTTTNPTVIDIDTVAGLTAPFSTSIPVLTAPLGGSATAAELKAGAELPADTVVQINSNAGAAAGDGDVVVTVQWY